MIMGRGMDRVTFRVVFEMSGWESDFLPRREARSKSMLLDFNSGACLKCSSAWVSQEDSGIRNGSMDEVSFAGGLYILTLEQVKSGRTMTWFASVDCMADWLCHKCDVKA